MNHRKIKKMLKAERQYFVKDIKTSVLSCKPELVVNKRFNKRLSLSTALVMLIAVLGIVGILQSKPSITPVYSNSIIVVDINPSIEFEVNEQGELVSYRPLNSDAVVLLSNLKLELNKPFQDAVDKVINEAKTYGYLTMTNAKITVLNENKKDELTLIELVKQLFSSDNKIEVITNEVSKDKNVSDGKYRIINQVLDLNLGYTYAELVKKDIKAINEIRKDYKGDQIYLLENQIDNIKDQQEHKKKSLLNQLDMLEVEVSIILDALEDAINDEDEFEVLRLYNLLKTNYFINLSDVTTIEDVETFLKRFKDYFEDFIGNKTDEIEDAFDVDVKSGIEAWKNNGFKGELIIRTSFTDDFVEKIKKDMTSTIKDSIKERQFFNLVERIEKQLDLLEDSHNSYIKKIYIEGLYRDFLEYMNSDWISNEVKESEEVKDMISDYEELMLP